MLSGVGRSRYRPVIDAFLLAEPAIDTIERRLRLKSGE
jgi:hypothetical protein